MQSTKECLLRTVSLLRDDLDKYEGKSGGS